MLPIPAPISLEKLHPEEEMMITIININAKNLCKIAGDGWNGWINNTFP